MTIRYIIFALSIVLLVACSGDVSQEVTQPALRTGMWRVVLNLKGDLNKQDTELPFSLQVYEEDNAVFADIINAEERITIKDIRLVGDSVYMRLPLFNSEIQCIRASSTKLVGHWRNFDRDDYALPLVAEYGVNHRFCSEDNTSGIPVLKGKFEVQFSPDDPEDNYPAIGQFESNITNNRVTGTFMTETGDYRFLEGNFCSGKLFLSCFDGSHAFQFEADVKGDSLINGIFRSGKHWRQPWIASRNEAAALSDPKHLTHIADSSAMKGLTFPAYDGSEYTIGDEENLGEVTILQVMGSWCPNCIDETMVFKEFHEKYHAQGLRIVPLAFEADGDESVGLAATKRLKERLALPYSIYYAGPASKKKAHERLPFLSSVSSFPTTIILDKEGHARDVHTGFYGPGTKEYYDNYVKETEAMILALLNE